MPIVRMYGFKLEGGGGNVLKKVFKNFSALNEITPRISWLRNQFFKNAKQKAQHQKNNRLFRKNNRLFIPIYKYKNWI